MTTRIFKREIGSYFGVHMIGYVLTAFFWGLLIFWR